MEAFNDYNEWATWTLRFADIPPLGSTPDAVARHVARASVFGALAANRLGPEAQYVSTAYVARDMLRITEAHGFEQLKYIGYSYGSVLGTVDVSAPFKCLTRLPRYHICFNVPGSRGTPGCRWCC
jgi:pimeloyl-ACP methyl ester carboxylesterase